MLKVTLVQIQAGMTKHKDEHTCFWCVVSLLRCICRLWKEWEDAGQNSKDLDNTLYNTNRSLG